MSRGTYLSCKKILDEEGQDQDSFNAAMLSCARAKKLGGKWTSLNGTTDRVEFLYLRKEFTARLWPLRPAPVLRGRGALWAWNLVARFGLGGYGTLVDGVRGYGYCYGRGFDGSWYVWAYDGWCVWLFMRFRFCLGRFSLVFPSLCFSSRFFALYLSCQFARSVALMLGSSRALCIRVVVSCTFLAHRRSLIY